jgi:class 3 adenylate cyclase
MQARVGDLAQGWRERGHDLGFGVGIAQGFATLGRVGFEGRYDYAAIGTVTNLAARLCGAAAAGQVLVSPRVRAGAGPGLRARSLGALPLHGLARPVEVFEVIGLDRTEEPP